MDLLWWWFWVALGFWIMWVLVICLQFWYVCCLLCLWFDWWCLCCYSVFAQFWFGFDLFVWYLRFCVFVLNFLVVCLFLVVVLVCSLLLWWFGVGWVLVLVWWFVGCLGFCWISGGFWVLRVLVFDWFLLCGFDLLARWFGFDVLVFCFNTFGWA